MRDVLTVLLGVATGALSGAFGVGGAVVAQPGLRALGASALIAIGTTLPSIIPSAASGTARYLREHLIDWRAVRWTAPAGMGVTVLGSMLSREVPGDGHVLQLVTATLLAATAVRMASGEGQSAAGAGRATPARYAVVGVVAGLLSGLLGIGGGIVMVPGFTQLVGLSVKSAIATSLVCVGIFAVPGAITHAVIGHVDWRFAALLVIGMVPGARFGAAAAIRANDRRLRLTVAALLGVIALVYAGGEIAALAS